MEKGPATLRSFEQVPREDAHNIQTHAVDLASLVSRVSFVLISASKLIKVCLLNGLLREPSR